MYVLLCMCKALARSILGVFLVILLPPPLQHMLLAQATAMSSGVLYLSSPY